MCSDKRSFIIFILCALLSLQFKCKKSLSCAENVYNFKTGIRAYPDTHKIQKGDSLWLEILEPVVLEDLRSKKMIDFSRAANLSVSISFAKLISENETDDKIASHFEYYIAEGLEILRADHIDKYRDYAMSEKNGFYKFKLAIIPNVAGVFKLFVSSAYNVSRVTDPCTKASFQINFIDTDQHFFLNKISFPEIDLFGESGVYLFEVE